MSKCGVGGGEGEGNERVEWRNVLYFCQGFTL